jgi:Zn-dependent alcohol dehydrogenase
LSEEEDATLETALAFTKKGGAVVLTGLSRVDAPGHRDVSIRHAGEAIDRVVYDAGQPLRDIPELVSQYERRQLKLRQLVARTYPLAGVNDALVRATAPGGISTS